MSIIPVNLIVKILGFWYANRLWHHLPLGLSFITNLFLINILHFYTNILVYAQGLN